MIVGIVGCGAIAHIIAQNIKDENTNIEIKYFYDKDGKRAEELANFVNGIAVSSGDVSRWSMLIGAFVVYNIIIKFHPESKRGLLLLLGIVLLFTIVFVSLS